MKTMRLVRTAVLVVALLGNPFASNAAATNGDDPTLSKSAAAAKHATYRLDSWKQVVHKWRMLGKAGLRLVDLEVLEHSSGERIFSGVWEPGTGKHALYRHDNWDAFVDKWEELSDDGYRLVDVERVRHGNKIWYYSVWRDGTDAYALYHYKSWHAFTDKWSDLNDIGMRLIDIDVTEEDGVTSYVGVWRDGGGKYALYGYNSWASFVDKWQELGDTGFRLIDMDVVRLESGTIQYYGVWRGGGPKRALYRYTTWKGLKKKWAELAEDGYSLLDVEVAERTATGKWFVGSFGPAPAAPAGGPDLQAMAQYLEDNLEPSVVGMAYALSQNGQLAIAGATGFAQRSPDSDIDMTSKIRSTVASVSKAITAPLVYKLLDANGLTVDDPVEPWLPANWVREPGFVDDPSGVTFHHLLTHTSGLWQEFDALKAAGLEEPWGNGWDGLKFVVENGTVPGSPRKYKNANFALFRIMIPKLWKAVGGPAGVITKNNVGDRYLDYLHELVLDREGIESIACGPQAGYPEAKSYNFNDPTLAGASNSSNLDACGGHANLHFSAQELTRYAAAFRYNRKIMTLDDLDTMRDDKAGWNGKKAVTDGTAYSHGGSWNKGGGRKTRTCVMELPNGVNASIIINSLPPLNACRSLRSAYDAAFD